MKVLRHAKTHLTIVIALSAIYCVWAQSSDSLSYAHFDLDACAANHGHDEQFDYSEFTAKINNSGACADLEVVGGYLFVENSDDNIHSCTPGVDGDPAMCIGSRGNCFYNPGSDKSLRFNIRITPGADGIAVLSGLSFFEQAPATYVWINSPSGPNNYPTLFKVRVLKNGQEVYVSPGMVTERQWNLRTFDFSGIDAFTVQEPTVFNFEMLAYCPVGNGAHVSAWDIDELTVSSNCCLILDGGQLEGGPFEFCVGDGQDDFVSGVSLSGNIGSQSQYVVTSEQGEILALPPTPEGVNFDGAGPGTCFIWHVSYFGTLGGLEVGNSLLADLIGDCYAVSNPITVERITPPEGGTLEGGPFEFCVGDGIADRVSGVSLSGTTGDSSQYVVTDDANNILGLPPSPEAVDFDDAGAGTCLIWHLSFDAPVSGLMLGNNLMNDVTGCFGLSNSITVVRNSFPEGGMVTGGPFEFCVGDGTPDNVSGIELMGATGANSQWVVTDTALNILGLPPMPGAVDFDGAGAGTCLIWHFSSNGTITGLEIGSNTADLTGCFAFSNAISVTRNQPAGGELTGGPYEFCIDSFPDFVDSLGLSGNSGESQWVITDTLGVILGLPSSPDSVDFNAADTGVCLIWHVSYIDSLVGAEIGNNALTDLMGCISFSNSITVTRKSLPCQDSIGGPPVIDVALMPNPVRGSLTMNFMNAGNDVVTVRIYDIYGRLWISEVCDPNDRPSFDMRLLPDGHYFINVQNRRGSKTRSVVLLR